VNEFGVKFRTIVADLSQDDFLDNLAQLTDNLDIGLVVSNAGAHIRRVPEARSAGASVGFAA